MASINTMVKIVKVLSSSDLLTVTRLRKLTGSGDHIFRDIQLYNEIGLITFIHTGRKKFVKLSRTRFAFHLKKLVEKYPQMKWNLVFPILSNLRNQSLPIPKTRIKSHVGGSWQLINRTLNDLVENGLIRKGSRDTSLYSLPDHISNDLNRTFRIIDHLAKFNCPISIKLSVNHELLC